MSAAVDQAPTTVESPARPRGFAARLLRKPLAVASLAWLAAISVLSVAAEQIAPFDPLDQDLLGAKQLPDAAHWLGTDALGRDVFSRLLFGGWPTLVGIAQATAVGCVLGIALGLIAGYFGGWIDRVVNQLVNLVMSLPSIVILLATLAVFQHDMLAAMVVVGILGSAGIARVIRSLALNVRGELYIEAARIAGLSDMAIITRHVAPRIMGPMLVQLSLFAAVAVLTQTGISFLGLGIRPPDPSWGGMIFEASVSLNDFPWLLVPSGLTVALTILAFGLLGDAARDTAAEGWTRPAGKSRAQARRANESTEAALPCPRNSLLSVRGLNIDSVSADGGRKSLVRNIDFDLSPGETLGVVGESGSGKTLTSLALIGLLPRGTHVSAGTMILAGETIKLTDERRLRALRGRVISMIFQEPMAALDPCFTVGHHIAEVIHRFERVSRGAAKRRVRALLEQVKIPDPDDIARRYPHQISGGMAQRVGIARALVTHPSILLADEPTTALDVTVQADILDLLRNLSHTRNMAVLLVTHDWGVVSDICDRAMVLYRGDVLECGDVIAMFERPSHAYTAALLRANPHNAPVGAPLPTIRDSLLAARDD